jgi:SAM-dependent methyltransferase
MKKSPEEHAARFDAKADEYDEAKSAEYRECLSLVVEHADPGPDETVLDLGCGTGAVALRLADAAGEVVGRDLSEGMRAQARRKAADAGHENVSFDEGSFREPDYDGDVDTESTSSPRAHTRSARVDVVVSNFAMHHLSDEEKREALQVIADLGARRFVLGDVMFFGDPDPSEPFYTPEVDDPATVGVLADAFTDAGFSLTAVECVHDQVGVLVGERPD